MNLIHPGKSVTILMQFAQDCDLQRSRRVSLRENRSQREGLLNVDENRWRSQREDLLNVDENLLDESNL